MIVIPMCGTHECNQGRGVVCTTGCGDAMRNAWKPPEQMTDDELARAYHDKQNAYASGRLDLRALAAAQNVWDEILAAQAEGARMCGAWPYTGTPTSPGPLSEDELDAHNVEFHSPAPRIPRLPLAVSRAGSSQHYAEAVSGPHGHRMGLWARLVWKWREWRADRMWPVDVTKR